MIGRVAENIQLFHILFHIFDLKVISMRAAPGKSKLQERNDRERGEVGQNGLHAHHRVHLRSRLIFHIYAGPFGRLCLKKEAKGDLSVLLGTELRGPLLRTLIRMVDRMTNIITMKSSHPHHQFCLTLGCR